MTSGEHDGLDAFGRPVEGSLWAGPAGAHDVERPAPGGGPDPRPAVATPAPGPRTSGPDGLVLADFGRRAEAAVIDALLRLAVFLVPTLAGGAALALDSDVGAFALLGGIAVGYLASTVYEPVLMARWDGQTVGHRHAKTRIVRTDGRPVGGGRAFVREVLVKGLLVDLIGGLLFYLPVLANYLWPLRDPRNQALHDKLCGTLVVRA